MVTLEGALDAERHRVPQLIHLAYAPRARASVDAKISTPKAYRDRRRQTDAAICRTTSLERGWCMQGCREEAKILQAQTMGLLDLGHGFEQHQYKRGKCPALETKGARRRHNRVPDFATLAKPAHSVQRALIAIPPQPHHKSTRLTKSTAQRLLTLQCASPFWSCHALQVSPYLTVGLTMLQARTLQDQFRPIRMVVWSTP